MNFCRFVNILTLFLLFNALIFGAYYCILFNSTSTCHFWFFLKCCCFFPFYSLFPVSLCVALLPGRWIRMDCLRHRISCPCYDDRITTFLWFTLSFCEGSRELLWKEETLNWNEWVSSDFYPPIKRKKNHHMINLSFAYLIAEPNTTSMNIFFVDTHITFHFAWLSQCYMVFPSQKHYSSWKKKHKQTQTQSFFLSSYCTQ